ncbi:PREDICTED: E3 ubiquitin ligase BIG BROTHER-related [Fragaria vesca subsp. vesca]|uniref:E3 ubiquitin ligase BIG BROTHER-related n=1 Tax=Fragaria vesca subsp. vesca TaxID=101020 RepID=UPI0002C30B6C|nr:PREDICTED: E3 ubiquitin ligase BIG BROTHER-related [Fragaria vesca subsp. vesca]
MENHNAKLVPSGGLKPNPGEQEENPTLNRCGEEEEVNTESAEPPSPNAPQSSRTPFTNLSQVDADLALARTLQEQERAYMMLRMNNEGSDYGSWEAGSYVHDDEDDFHDDTDGNDDDEHYDGTDADNDEEDAFDVHAHEDAGDDHNPSVVYDPAVFSSDEAYARALQDAEDRDMAARLMAFAGIDDREAEDTENQGGNSQDAWEEVDPDELSYEELLALGEVVGTESRGLPADTIASLPSVSYKMGNGQNGSNESCAICRLDYEDGENLTVLSCTHSYHSECINNWLTINKVCPVCIAEVSTSGNS